MSEVVAVVSVVVPIYKVPEKLLRKCLDSLSKQTLKDCQFILVDDESPDSDGIICDEYASKDSRFVVIHQKNKGLSGARNSGFLAASGEYVMFLDGDDFLEENACSEAVNRAKVDGSDVVFWNIVTEYSNSTVFNKCYEGGTRPLARSEISELRARTLNFNGKIAQVFAKLFRRDFLAENKLMHHEKLRQGAEGIVFNFEVFEFVRSASYLDEYLNHYVYNEDSISHSPNIDNYYLILDCFEYIKSKVALESDNSRNVLLDALYQRMLYVVITTGVSGFFNPSNVVSYHEKKRGFNRFLGNELVAESIKKGKRKKLSIQRKILLRAVDFNWLFIFYIAGKLRKLQYLKR